MLHHPVCLKLNLTVADFSLFPRLILTFKVTESRFDRDSAGSEVEEEEAGEGTPHSNAMSEGDYIPDSPASSPIELKQELPKYLPALQVEDYLMDVRGCHRQIGFCSHCFNIIKTSLCMREFTVRLCLADSASQSTHFCVKYSCLFFLTRKKCAWSKNEMSL